MLGYYLPPHNPFIASQFVKQDKYTVILVNYVGNHSVECARFIEQVCAQHLCAPRNLLSFAV